MIVALICMQETKQRPGSVTDGGGGPADGIVAVPQAAVGSSCRCVKPSQAQEACWYAWPFVPASSCGSLRRGHSR
jgi:hypothetical protein